MLAEDLNSLARCVELLGIGCLTEQSMPELVQIIVSTITQHFERQTERNQKRKDEDYDEGVEDQVKINPILVTCRCHNTGFNVSENTF